MTAIPFNGPPVRNSFFSSINEFLGNAQQTASNAMGIYQTVSPIWTGPVAQSTTPQPQPTFVAGPQMTPTVQTTAPPMVQPSMNQNTLVIGAMILVAIILVMRS